ncbi:DMT family transporter [Flammeovirgaceae bacterium SG7u.111]|nr:DMT family transporter [Flammeovirgaceae bacterium SG7u.132]WPO36272.1 DMT family transporter [Flammeovirgaceae bacterium SG7u.111]
MLTRNFSDYLWLHLIILLSSIIPVIVIYISIPAFEIVFYRTIVATLFLGSMLYFKKVTIRLNIEESLRLMLSGVLTAIYWILLIISAKISNASVCLIGISTSPLWTSFITPFVNKEKFSYLQIITALLVILGIVVITRQGFEHPIGLTVSIIAGFFGALVTIINARLSRNYNHYIISFYQMAGAWLGTIALAPIYYFVFDSNWNINLNLTPRDALLILVLVLIFSVYMYSKFIQLMRSVSPYIVTLTANLSPVYGMIIALIFLGESEKMSLSFYEGSAIIIGAILFYHIAKKYVPTR